MVKDLLNYLSDIAIKEVKSEHEKYEYIPLSIITERTVIDYRYYKVDNANTAAIWVGGVGGGWDTPDDNLYPKLAVKLKEENKIASLRVKFRYSSFIEEAVYDVLVGIKYLEDQGIKNIALIGHSFGGAVVIQTAAISKNVKTVITLASQSYGAHVVADLPESTSILLIHGDKDKTLPASCSKHIFSMAHKPRHLIIYPDNNHMLNETASELEKDVYNWIVNHINT